MSVLSPREMFRRIQEATLAKDVFYSSLYAEDGVHEFPFAPTGGAKHIEGRENIRTLLNRAHDAAHCPC
jgi:hypothetical protein